MSISDSIADMLTKIRNGSMAGFDKVDVTPSKFKLEIVKIFKSAGYIRTFKAMTIDEHNFIRVFLKYDKQDNPIIHGIKKISTPGRRVYSGYKKLPRIYNDYGTLVISTSAGVTTGKKASEKKLGGELICSIW